MGYPDTTLTSLDILGIRLTDLYDKQAAYDVAALTLDELCAKHGWTQPWSRERAEMDHDDGSIEHPIE
jgi:hypothetical protein